MILFHYSWEMFLEILMLWGAYYVFYLLFKDTAAEQVIKGILVIFVVLLMTRGMNLVIINWLLTRLLAISVIAFLIIFQPEIRRGLARIGRFGVFYGEKKILEEISKAAVVMSKRYVGALIALQREIGLRRYVESGVSIDARVTSELINTIFAPNTSLHDGGLIISEQRIEAAACLFPLTQNPNVPKTMGTRHRAALGLSDETDAVILVVSEETGGISIVANGSMIRDIEPENVQKVLEKNYSLEKRKNTFLSGVQRLLSKYATNEAEK